MGGFGRGKEGGKEVGKGIETKDFQNPNERHQKITMGRKKRQRGSWEQNSALYLSTPALPVIERGKYKKLK